MRQVMDSPGGGAMYSYHNRWTCIVKTHVTFVRGEGGGRHRYVGEKERKLERDAEKRVSTTRRTAHGWYICDKNVCAFLCTCPFFLFVIARKRGDIACKSQNALAMRFLLFFERYPILC
jgi:hypothetical protein